MAEMECRITLKIEMNTDFSVMGVPLSVTKSAKPSIQDNIHEAFQTHLKSEVMKLEGSPSRTIEKFQ